MSFRSPFHVLFKNFILTLVLEVMLYSKSSYMYTFHKYSKVYISLLHMALSYWMLEYILCVLLLLYYLKYICLALLNYTKYILWNSCSTSSDQIGFDIERRAHFFKIVTLLKISHIFKARPIMIPIPTEKQLYRQ